MSMQHECNTSESSLQEILRDLFGENTIDEMMKDPGWGPEDAVELAEILVSVKAGDPKIELPVPILLGVLDCAKRGMHKGGGQGRPRKSYIEGVVNRVVINWARDLKAQLHAQGLKNTGANSAEDKAAEKAQEALARLFRNTRYATPAVSTIKRRMQSTGE